MSWNESSEFMSWQHVFSLLGDIHFSCRIILYIHQLVDLLPGQPLQSKAFSFSVAEDVTNLIFI